MGVYIEGLDIPSNCYECPLSDHDWKNKTYCKLKNRKDSLENGYAREHKRDDCPLIEIDIVRCKDCKHSKECTYLAKWNWCPDGERKGE